MSLVTGIRSQNLKDVLDKHRIPYLVEGDKITADLDLSKFSFKVKCEIAKVIVVKEHYAEWKQIELNRIIKSMY